MSPEVAILINHEASAIPPTEEIVLRKRISEKTLMHLEIRDERVPKIYLLNRQEETFLAQRVERSKKARNLLQQGPIPKPDTSLLDAYIRDGNEAFDDLAITNKRLVYKVINTSFTHSDVPPNDLADEGIIGLFTAIDYFDWRQGNRLSTLAFRCIRSRILDVFYKVPQKNRTISLDENPTNDSEKDTTFYDLVKDINAESPEGDERAIMTLLYESIEGLKPMWRDTLILHYGFPLSLTILQDQFPEWGTEEELPKYTLELIGQRLGSGKRNICYFIEKAERDIRLKMVANGYLDPEKVK